MVFTKKIIAKFKYFFKVVYNRNMIRKDIKSFAKTLQNRVRLVVATKYYDIDDLSTLLDAGIKDFGENRVDSFLPKYEYFKGQDVCWHFIGHLQRNKAKKVLNKINYLHSLDSLELAKMINDVREKDLPTLIEVSVNEEENKNGVKIRDLDAFIKEVLKYPKVKPVGLMMMAIDGSDEESLHHQFAKLRETRDQLEKKFNFKLPELSMGMSHDYLIAIKEGATMVRLGHIIG